MTDASGITLFDRAAQAGERVAILAEDGVVSYRDLLNASTQVALFLLQGRRDLEETRVAFLVPPGFEYVAVQWGIWRAGGVAVPLAVSHPPPELERVIGDADPSSVIARASLASKVRPIAEAMSIRFATTTEALAGARATPPLRAPLAFAEPDAGPYAHPPSPFLPLITGARRAQMIYTSGTTGNAKGVVTTHLNTEAQVESLVEAWEMTADDHVLNALPLHHVHGIINALTCTLWSGGCCEILSQFDADEVWDRIAERRVTVFMGVPTMYARLIAAWGAATPARQRSIRKGCGHVRVMISGSAALPVHTLERWREISGHVLLERYGMTEIGMALSNPLRGERMPGHVGTALPGVQVRLVEEDGYEAGEDRQGTIEVRGPTVFLEYWRHPSETASAFRDGWFRTGDVAIVESGHFRILGRESVDIIKTGGEKISALEVEEVLRAHPLIEDCAVVGIPDPEWGERVCAAIVLRGSTELPTDVLRGWAKGQLAPYKAPTLTQAVVELPRNEMGKVVKPAVQALFTPEETR